MFALTQISGDVLKNTEIRSDLHKLVWNVYIKPSTFESRWEKLMEKHGLAEHEWLREMFSIKELWAPTYIRDIPMCCLMKTTSRCESSNASFKVNSMWSNTLVQFLLCFYGTMDFLRYNQRVATFRSDERIPKFKKNYNVIMLGERLSRGRHYYMSM